MEYLNVSNGANSTSDNGGAFVSLQHEQPTLTCSTQLDAMRSTDLVFWYDMYSHKCLACLHPYRLVATRGDDVSVPPFRSSAT